jgi:hypothetical protein
MLTISNGNSKNSRQEKPGLFQELQQFNYQQSPQGYHQHGVIYGPQQPAGVTVQILC